MGLRWRTMNRSCGGIPSHPLLDGHGSRARFSFTKKRLYALQKLDKCARVKLSDTGSCSGSEEVEGMPRRGHGLPANLGGCARPRRHCPGSKSAEKRARHGGPWKTYLRCCGLRQ